MIKRAKRQPSGFSLVTVLAVTVLATLWLTATLANLISVYRSASSSKFSSEICSYADSATALVMQALNDPSLRSTYDNKTNVPISGPNFGAPTDVTATVTVVSQNPSNSLPITPMPLSILYDPTASSYIPKAANQFGTNFSLVNSMAMWRIITTTVQYAGLTKTIQVVAGPPHIAASTAVLPATTAASNIPFGSPAGTSPFFSGAILSTGNMQIGSNFATSGYDFVANAPVMASDGVHALGGDITSYSPVNLSGSNLSIGGSLTAMSVNTFSSLVTAQTQTPASTTVNRYVNTSGSVMGFSDGSGNFGQTATNVLGLTNSSMQNQTQIIQTQQNAAAAQANNPVLPTPAAPGNAQAGLTITTPSSNGTTTPPSQIAAGDYSASSLAISSATSLAVTGSGPARVYLDSGSSTASINGTINAGGLPANFQIFYGGIS